jgi:CRISP-associated protein Cas1
MSWRSITIANDARISLRADSLVVKQEEEEFLVPLEDIGVLVLESRHVLLTTALLDACVRHKIAVLVCDEKHLPSGCLIGYQQHSRQWHITKAQCAWSAPFQKNTWRTIVQQKIHNQASVMKKMESGGAVVEKLQHYAKTVRSGDTTNREGAAAQIYFSALLPADTHRGSDTLVNTMLNYCYALVRASLARHIAAYGFLGSMGIWHKSELNNFNLADDLLESFRPFVDLHVVTYLKKHPEIANFGKDAKQACVALLHMDVLLKNEKSTVLRATERVVQSLSSATQAKDTTLLSLPTL